MLKKIPGNVYLLGLVSFFNDIASEMIYPIVPIFLTSILGAPVALVGVIEGVAEATASVMRFASGYASDKARKRKVFVSWGYGLGAISKLIIGFASSWVFVLFARFIDRLGKGIRTTARDSLLLQSTNGKNKGFIFGFHRAMDSFGAVIGPLLAIVLLFFFKDNMRMVFFIAFIPSVIGVILLVLFVKEKKFSKKDKKIKINLKWNLLSPRLKLFLIISFVFALGNSSDAFILLRAKELGLATVLVTLTYVLYNTSQTLFATPAGQLADKIGARKVFAIGILVFAIVYFLFGFISSPVWIWFIFPIYGIYIAATDGVSKAYIARFITEKNSGTYFGFYQAGMAVCQFFASFVGGVLWSKVSPSATFYFGSAMAFLALLILFYGKTFRKI
jgi:MFS family permease